MQRRLALSVADYSVSQSREVLDASNLKIKYVDEVSGAMARNVKVLNLSGNLLAKLDNMRQFVSLKEIDITNNCIRNGSEIMCLAQLPKLLRICVKGNPFLLDPLDEDVLELLIEKETDIEILSGEALNRMRDLEEGELKVVFLENYLKKMNCHDEMSRRGGQPSESRSAMNEESRNRLILNKIMPQFYSIIEDPRLGSKIKRETIGLKREEQLTFEDAMKKRKEKQQTQVDNLIKDILLLVEEQDEDKYQSSQNIEEQDPRHPDNWETDPQKMDSPEGFRRKLNRIKNNLMNSQLQENYPTSRPEQKSRKTPKATQTKIDHMFSGRNQTSVFSPRISEPFSHEGQESPSTKLRFNESSNFYSFNRTTPLPFDKRPLLGEKWQQDFQTQKQPEKIREVKEEEPIQESTRRKHQEDGKDEQGIEGEEELKSAAELYDQYYVHLTKYNPAFALLYSQINTLSSEEKFVLIEALAKDHKNKTIELFMERAKVRGLKLNLTESAGAHEKEKYDLQCEVAEQRENFKLCKQYADQLHKENGRLGELIKVISEDITDAKQENKEYRKVVTENEKLIAKLEEQLRAKDNQLVHFAKCEDIAELIRANRDKALKAKYLKLVGRRAEQNMQVLRFRDSRERRGRARMLYICWSLMKKHLLVQMLARMKAGEKNSSTLKSCFIEWRTEVELNKVAKEKGNRLSNLLKLKALKCMRGMISKLKAAKKQRKLSVFWADHHFLKSCFFKLKNRTKKSKLLAEGQMEKSIQHQKDYLKSRIFNKMKQFAKEGKNNLEVSAKKLRDHFIHRFYNKLNGFYRKNLVNEEKRNRLKAIARVMVYQLEDKRKLEAIKNLKRENEEVKWKQSYVAKTRKDKQFRKLVDLMGQKVTRNRIKLKLKALQKSMYWERFWGNLKKSMKHTKTVVQFFGRCHKKMLRSDAKLERKSIKLESQLKRRKSKGVFHGLIRNMYERKVVGIEVRQRLEQEETSKLLQKMRALESMELEAVRSEHHKQMQLIEEEEIRKEMSYRNTLMAMENNRNELEDAVRGLKREMEELKQRENLFFKEKQLIEDQVRMAEQGNQELTQLNEDLRVEIGSMNSKYQRMLELYTQAMIQIEKREKHLDLVEAHSRDKERDKTVEKERRQVGLAKNGDFTSLRNRIP